MLVGTLKEITGPISGSADNPYVPAIISFTDRNGNPSQTPLPVLVPSHRQVGDSFTVWQSSRNKEVFVAEDLQRYTSTPYPSPAAGFVTWLFRLEAFPFLLYLLFAHGTWQKGTQEQREQLAKGVTSIRPAA